MKIVLVGNMGSGKSTIGKRLAKALKLDFVDSDVEIEKRTGTSIVNIFDIEGEVGFRVREETVLSELLLLDNVVIATGGGCILSETTIQNLKKCDTVVYLSINVGTQFLNVVKDKNRPLLQVPDLMQVLIGLSEIRNPLYAEVATITIESKGIASTLNTILSEVTK